MKYASVIFDLDGTLLNTLSDIADSVNFALRALNMPERTEDEVRSFVGNGIKRLIQRSVPDGTDEKTTEECRRIFSENYASHSMVKTVPYDGIEEMLKTLKSKGIKTAVVTNKTDAVAVEIINILFGSLIDFTIGSTEKFPRKPVPDVVYYAMERIGAEKESSVYVGDSDVDCLTGHNAGLPVIGVTWGFRGRKVLEENGADMIAESPAEICRYIGVDK